MPSLLTPEQSGTPVKFGVRKAQHGKETFPLSNAFNGVINLLNHKVVPDFYGAKPQNWRCLCKRRENSYKSLLVLIRMFLNLKIDIYITANQPQDAILWNGGNIGGIPSTAGCIN